jgi:predicted transcriptional regulator
MNMLEDFPAMSAKVDDGSLTCYDLMRCMFNLNATEAKVLRSLQGTEPTTAAGVAEIIERDRSTTYRALEKLVSTGLVYKERRGGEVRGYSNVYSSVSEIELVRKAETMLDDCYSRIKSILAEQQKE